MQGNLDTVAVMRQLAHEAAGNPEFQRFARSVVHHVLSHYYADEARAVGEFVQSQVRYAMDPAGFEQLQEPALMLSDVEKGIAAGDCDDMALLSASLLLALGHYPFFRVVRYSGNRGPFNHIYVVDYARNGDGPGERVVLDCIVKDQPIGHELAHASGEEIEV